MVAGSDPTVKTSGRPVGGGDSSTERRMSRPVKEVDGSMVYGITGSSYNLLINGIYWLVVIGSLG